ncbi:MAG: AbrB family transcriptional regulator [Brevundimonas sp. 12-68-7]|nr:MAG: AbrB family transcriptional regulator [Brevundimonas sp. 12-68-7]
MSNTTTLSSKFQISVPKEVREELGWKAPKGKSVVLVPVPELEDLFGMAKGADPSGYRDRNDRY